MKMNNSLCIYVALCISFFYDNQFKIFASFCIKSLDSFGGCLDNKSFAIIYSVVFAYVQ